MDEDEEVDESAYAFEAQQALMGITQDASRTGGGSLALGSMVLRGAQKRDSESAVID